MQGCVCSSLVKFFIIRVFFEKLKSHYNQHCVKDVIGLPSYVNEVKGHMLIYFMLVTMILDFRLGFHYSCLLRKVEAPDNQRWIKDAVVTVWQRF